MNLDWQDHAACKGMDTELFFPSDRGMHSTHQARMAARVCAQCPVAKLCGEYAEATHSVGIWGGSVQRTNRSQYRPPDDRHGTEAMQRKHLRRGEKPCAACLEAARIANADRRARRRSA